MSRAPRTRDPDLEASSSDDERGDGARTERGRGLDDSSDAAAAIRNDDGVDLDGETRSKRRVGGELDREWESRRARFYNTGYREGLESGHEQALQPAFDSSFATGVRRGLHWGLVAGAAAAAGGFAKAATATTATGAEAARRAAEAMLPFAATPNEALLSVGDEGEGGEGAATTTATTTTTTTATTTAAAAARALSAAVDALAEAGVPLPTLDLADETLSIPEIEREIGEMRVEGGEEKRRCPGANERDDGGCCGGGGCGR